MTDEEIMEKIDAIKFAGLNATGKNTVSKEFSDKQAYEILIRSEELIEEAHRRRQRFSK